MAQTGNRVGKTQPCMQMGGHEFEWVPVTSSSMNVCNSALLFFCAVGLEQEVFGSKGGPVESGSRGCRQSVQERSFCAH